MKHYILMKLSPAADADKVKEIVWDTYQALDRELDWLNHPQVFTNCVTRDQNADIMAVIDLDSDTQLDAYLKHPLHLKMAEALKDDVVSRVSFDHF